MSIWPLLTLHHAAPLGSEWSVRYGCVMNVGAKLLPPAALRGRPNQTATFPRLRYPRSIEFVNPFSVVAVLFRDGGTVSHSLPDECVVACRRPPPRVHRKMCLLLAGPCDQPPHPWIGYEGRLVLNHHQPTPM